MKIGLGIPKPELTWFYFTKNLPYFYIIKASNTCETNPDF